MKTKTDEVVELLTLGKTRQQIMQILGLTSKNVATYAGRAGLKAYADVKFKAVNDGVVTYYSRKSDLNRWLDVDPLWTKETRFNSEQPLFLPDGTVLYALPEPLSIDDLEDSDYVLRASRYLDYAKVEDIRNADADSIYWRA